jgi:pilus assembly protein CpaB
MRNRRAILFLGLALLLGLAAVFSAQRWLEGQIPSTTTGPVTTEVVVTRAEAAAGTALTGNILTTASWPREFVPEGSFATVESLHGRVPRRPLSAGEPVLAVALLPEGSEAGLSSLIQRERRAISVKVDQVIGVAGFVRPGARVDVLATVRRVDQRDSLPYTKVILQDIPVLAIDQQLETASDGDPEVVNVVTLEVNPEDAERLIYSAHEGKLQLALRNPGDRTSTKTRSAGVRDVLGTRYRGVAKRKQVRVEVFRGSARSVQSF